MNRTIAFCVTLGFVVLVNSLAFSRNRAICTTDMQMDYVFVRDSVCEQQLKPRVVILTDIASENVEPDDMQSMIRLMAYADLFEIEALVATSGWNSSGGEYPLEWIDNLRIAVDQYERDLHNLMQRSEQKDFLADENLPQKIGYWPSADYIRSRIMVGSRSMGHRTVGAENRSDASDYIINLVDESDERPLWILAWGGANTLAQAVWQVEQERSPEQIYRFLNKLRVYAITDQDVPWRRRGRYAMSSHQGLRERYPKDLLFIWDESTYTKYGSVGVANWGQYTTHIQGHGELGEVYPKYKYGVEGDTPSLLHVLPNGLNDPSVPDMVGWGGYFQWQKTKDNITECYANHKGEAKHISQDCVDYFYSAIFNDFAARMDWAQDGKGNRNPVVIVNGSDGLDVIRYKAKAGSSITLSAEQTFDIDGDELYFRWWMPHTQKLEIDNPTSAVITINIPEDASTEKFYIICEVVDDGTPNLTAYRSVVIEVE